MFIDMSYNVTVRSLIDVFPVTSPKSSRINEARSSFKTSCYVYAWVLVIEHGILVIQSQFVMMSRHTRGKEQIKLNDLCHKHRNDHFRCFHRNPRVKQCPKWCQRGSDVLKCLDNSLKSKLPKSHGPTISSTHFQKKKKSS